MPTPTVTISTSGGNLYAGTTTPLILTCFIDVDPALSSFVNVSVTWLRGTAALMNANDSHFISISSLPDSHRFTSNLTVSELSTLSSTNYTCMAGIVPLDDVISATASDSSEDTVQVVVEGVC